MSLENKKEQLLLIIMKYLGLNSNDYDSYYINTNMKDLGIDSFEKLELILIIEKEFNIKISNEKIELSNQLSIQEFISLVFEKNKNEKDI